MIEKKNIQITGGAGRTYFFISSEVNVAEKSHSKTRDKISPFRCTAVEMEKRNRRNNFAQTNLSVC